MSLDGTVKSESKGELDFLFQPPVSHHQLARRQPPSRHHTFPQGPTVTMPTKQLKNFRIRCTTREDEALDPRDCGWFFDKLHTAKHPSKDNKCLELKQLFSREGDRTFLINLKTKATLTFVLLILKQALGAHYTCNVEPVEILKRKGEKFAPGEREAEGRCKATIEREAATATTAAGLSSSTFVLIDGMQRATYWYDGPTDKLVRRKRELRGASVDIGRVADPAKV